MKKTFRINMDLEFTNGQVLTMEHEAQGENIEEARKNAQLDLSLRIGHFIKEIRPLNFYEQIDPLPQDEEDAAELLAQSETEEPAPRRTEIEREKAEFLRDMLVGDLENLIDRLENEPDLCLDALEHQFDDTELDDIIGRILAGYRGFINESVGSVYYDSWMDQQQDDEIGSLLNTETPTE